jgi:hypothetical protein
VCARVLYATRRIAILASVTASTLIAKRATAAAPAEGGVQSGVAPPSLSAAAPPPPLAGSSACPRAEEMWAALGTLIPPDRLGDLAGALSRGTRTIEIVDLGAAYRIIADQRVREYHDDARDCAHRARVAAVFVALTVDATAPIIRAAPPPAPPPAPAPAPPSAPPRSRAARLELGGILDLGVVSDDGGQAIGGLALRAAVARDAWALVIGAALVSPADVSVNGTRAHQWRLPADVGVRALLIRSRVELSAELGLALALLSERALDVVRSQTQTTLEVGGRAAITLRFSPQARVAPFIALHTEIVPRPPALYVLPQGVVGHTPTIWAGATAGASLSFF